MEGDRHAIVGAAAEQSLLQGGDHLGLHPERQGLPYCVAAGLSLFFTLWGTYSKRQGLRMACRTAAAASEPYLVTLDEKAWNGRSAYAKWSGSPIGFGSQIQEDDGAQRIFRGGLPCCARWAARWESCWESFWGAPWIRSSSAWVSPC